MADKTRILITGASGLIGSQLAFHLESSGYEVVPMDLRPNAGAPSTSILRPEDVSWNIRGCTGVVHLAAVSRVIDGERYPDLCWETNVTGTRNILRIIERMDRKPWFILGSSREVYGQAYELPVTETHALEPVNLYARSKVAAEALVKKASSEGVKTVIVRFSNVYGSVTDYPDRVVPAFARSAVTGASMRVDGPGHVFDFVHIKDAVDGIVRIIETLRMGYTSLPPLHLATGIPTSLEELAQLCNSLGGNKSTIIESSPRSFDVLCFYGDTSRAAKLLGWEASISLQTGVEQLIHDFRELEFTNHNPRSGKVA